MKHKNNKIGWTTDDEIDYINNIGNHHQNMPYRSKIPLLRSYIETAEKRIDWGCVDGDQAIRQAKGILRGLVRIGG